jgi:predicted enzyme related to lactoylglutathione lyase
VVIRLLQRTPLECIDSFAVDGIEEVLSRLQAQGRELIGELTQYQESYRLCSVCGPEGIIVALAERLGWLGELDGSTRGAT